MKKKSAPVKQIKKNLDPAIVERSKEVELSVDPELKKNLVKKYLKQVLKFEVGDYEVTLYLDAKDDVKLSCTCNFWKYQGAEYHAKTEGYLAGELQGTGEEPLAKDPEGKNKLCKHALAVLNAYLGR